MKKNEGRKSRASVPLSIKNMGLGSTLVRANVTEISRESSLPSQSAGTLLHRYLEDWDEKEPTYKSAKLRCVYNMHVTWPGQIGG
jgi:hypothetical protein